MIKPNLNYMNSSLNESNSTITLEEEVNEDYEPTHQEIRQYATQLGMKLPEDNQYLDIAKAGLKAKLPDEWKPCQKFINGEEAIFYKNKLTNEITQEHPCDLIYRKKYMEAKQVDMQASKNKKGTGISKFKQQLQQARQEDNKAQTKNLLDGPDDQSFMVESSTFNQQQQLQQQQQGYVVQNPSMLLTNSATQQLFIQVDQEFQIDLQKFEESKKKELGDYKEENKQKLNKMEIMLMNESDPELFELKDSYLSSVENLQKEQEEKQIKLKRKVELEFEEKLQKANTSLIRQIDRKVQDKEFEQDKELKKQLRQYEQELQQSHKEIIKRINQRQKEISEMDSKVGREVQEKKKRVEKAFDQFKKDTLTDNQHKLQQFEQEQKRNLKQQMDKCKQQMAIESEPKIRNLRSDILDCQQEYTAMIRQIKEEISDKYEPRFQALQENFNENIQQFELSNSQLMQSAVLDYKQDSTVINHQKKLKDRYATLEIQLKNQLVEFEKQQQDYHNDLRVKLEEQKRTKLERIQKDLEKKYGVKMGGTKEIDLYMEISQTKTAIHDFLEGIKKMNREKSNTEEKYLNLRAVYIKHDLERETKQLEIIKYELVNKQVLVEQLKLNDQELSKELEQLELKNKSKIMKEQQQKQYQMQTMMNSINEMKELIINQNDSKFYQTNFQQNQEQETNQQIRKWQSTLVEERVQLNRKKEIMKDDKDRTKQLEKKLLSQQDIVKQEIQMAKQLKQGNCKRDILKKMKSEVQHQLLKLTDAITQLNTQRAVLKQKEKALLQMEQNIQENQGNPTIIQTLEQMFQLYQKIEENGDEINIQEIENISKVNESYFQQIRVLSESGSFQFQQKQHEDKIEFNLDELVEKQQHQTHHHSLLLFKQHHQYIPQQQSANIDATQQRMNLLNQKEWLQNFKYKVINTNPYNPESRDKLSRYQLFLQQKV